MGALFIGGFIFLFGINLQQIIMKKLFLHSLVLLFCFCLSSCDNKEVTTETELTSNQIEINGTVYEILNKFHNSWEYEVNEQTLTNHQLMIMNPEVHLNIIMRDEYVGTTIDLTENMGEDGLWSVVCAGNVSSETSVNIGGTSYYTDDFGTGSYITTKAANGNYNLAFKIINADGSVTLRANIQGGFSSR